MNFFDPKSVQFLELNTKLKEQLEKAYEEKQLAIENLTKDQTCEVFRQIILSGDIVRYVTQDESQCVVYIPFREHQFLQNENNKLRHKLEELQTKIKEINNLVGNGEVDNED